MKEVKKHPVLTEAGDIIFSILSGCFALIAIIFVWVREIISKKKDKK